MPGDKPHGRPKLPDGKARSVIVPVRFRPTEHKRVLVAAEAEGLAVGVWIRRVAIAALAAQADRDGRTP